MRSVCRLHGAPLKTALMDLLDRRFLFVVGKGGVGKTTVATGLALAASRRGKKVLLAMVNCKERASELLDTEPIGPEIITIGENLDAVNMTPDAALEEYGMMILKVRAVYNAVFKNKLVRAFLKGTPGLEAWSMLGKAFYHSNPPRGEPDYDLVIVDAPPLDADAWDRLEPVYESFPGWQESSRGATTMGQLPDKARSYLAAMEDLCGAPVHIVSTGPDRAENILRQYPFDI